MSGKDLESEIELRRKKHREEFSNYENAVGLICSLEAWFEYRWGPDGKAQAGLLDYFNRFPYADGLTPDFEVRFHTPYVIWGDHKRTIQPTHRERSDVDQILKYAARGQSDDAGSVNYDVLVLVNSENDDIAAKAISVARQQIYDEPSGETPKPKLAPIIVVGCHLDRESIEGEWYKIKWRNHHENHRFSVPNISPDPKIEDLNALFVDGTHHVIPVNKPALDLSGRNPFINDPPPAFYTAIRLLIPALNSLLSDDERDVLQATGRVEKLFTKSDLLATEVVLSMEPQPVGLPKWVEAALQFLTIELNYARRIPNTDPLQYEITIDNNLIKGDPRDLFADRAAAKAAKSACKASTSRGHRRRRLKGDDPGQMSLFS